jgi:hypothetical protein
MTGATALNATAAFCKSEQRQTNCFSICRLRENLAPSRSVGKNIWVDPDLCEKAF